MSGRSEETIFKQALKVDSKERLSFIRKACQDDQQLLSRVFRLLEIDRNEPDFLESPPSAVRVPAETAGDDLSHQLIDSQIGPYTIREQIGEGGMGIVYLAEQRTPVRRKVALKVIKPGMDSKEIVSRFEAERQALAVMEHPSIAKVLDAGVTDSGRSYFAMELVRGISITEYCDQVRSSMKERLRLFMDVCDAVQHAHQKGVIHRDIKPSNILVTQIDGNPVVKVIDFGLAKATGSQQLTDRTIYTGFMKLMGTPQYMSPEQVGLSGQDIDTRTDIYSLGVVLYELLTGTTPLDLDSIREQPYDEICRRIREVETPSPSARISTIQNQQRSTIAQRRCITPQQLGATLKGDLDLVVLKALAKDRTCRYETASSLAADVQHYLNDEPVTAVAPGVSYVLGKLIKRHRTAITIASAFVVFLLIASIVSTLFAIQSRQEAENAKTQSKRAEDALVAEKEANENLELERDQARRLRDQAEHERERALAMWYVNDIRNLYTISHDGDIQQFDRPTKLAQWAPVDGEVDRRGWEWFYLNSMTCNAHRFLHQDPVKICGIASDHDARFIASLSCNGGRGSILSIWNIEAERTTFNAFAHEVEGSAIAWNPAGDLIVTGCNTGELKLWKVDHKGATAELWRTVRDHTNQITHLAFSPDGKFFVSTSDDQRAIVWDAGSAKTAAIFAGHGHEVDCANWHPDGKTVVSASSSAGEVCFWDPMTGEETAPRISEPGVKWAIWHPSGDSLATLHPAVWPNDTLTIRDRREHTPIFERTLPMVKSLFWHPSHEMLVTNHWSWLKVWGDASDRAPRNILEGHTFGASAVPVGDRLATTGADHTIRLWQVNQDHFQTISTDSPVAIGAWSPIGGRIAYLASGRVHVLSTRNWKPEIVIQDETTVEAFDWSPDGQRIATWDFQKITIWDAETGGRLMSFETDHNQPGWTNARTVAWHPTEERLITAIYDNVNIWDTSRGKRLQHFAGYEDLASWSPDGSGFVLSHPESDWTRVIRGTEVKTLPGSGHYAWSPDGKRFVVGRGTEIIICSTSDGTILQKIRNNSIRGKVTAVAWHPDGTRVATATDSGVINLWNVESGQPLLYLREHSEQVSWIGFSPDGMRLASAGDDNKILVWDATVGYHRGRSPWLLEQLKTQEPSEAISTEELLSRARVYANDGQWSQAAKYFDRASAALGDETPACFAAGEWIVGPYPGDPESRYPPENLVQFSPQDSILGGPRLPLQETLRWRLADPDFRQGARIPGIDVGQAAYALARIYAPRRTHIACLAGASRFDLFNIWHNGKLIHKQQFVAGRWPDEAYVPATLEPGWNTFLIKILNVEFRETALYLYFRLSAEPTCLARAYERMKDTQKALSLIEEAQTKYPTDADLLLVRALTHSRSGSSDASVKDFQHAESLLGKDRLALKYYEFGGPNLTATLHEALLAMPDNLKLRAFRADRHADDWSSALQDELLLAQHGQYQYRVESLALLFAVSGKEQQYRQKRELLLQRIAAGEPEYDVGVGGWHQMFACLAAPTTQQDLKKIDKLYQWYHSWPKSPISDPHGRLQKLLEGLLAHRHGDDDRAIELLSDAAKYETALDEPWMERSARQRSATANAYLAMALYRVGRVDEARAALQLAKDSPHNGRIYAQIAIREAMQVVGE